MRKFLFLCILLISVSGCSKSIGPRVAGENYEGTIVSDSSELKYVVGGWVPTTDVIAELEKTLPTYIQAQASTWNEKYRVLPPLNEFKRQYRGATKDGHHVIFIHLFHESLVKSGLWRRSFGISGGGNRVLHATYDVSTKQFIALNANADA